MRKRTAVPHVRFYASDWLSGTAQLSAQERGVYITLLSLFWDEDGRLKNDLRRLATACGMRVDRFQKTLDGLVEAGKIEIRGGYIYNHRAEIELIEARTARVKDRKSPQHNDGLSDQKSGTITDEKPNDINEPSGQNQEPRTKSLSSNELKGRSPPPTTPEADLFRRVRRHLGQPGGSLLAKLRRDGVPDADLVNVLDRYDRGEIGDLRQYLGGMSRRGPPKSHAVAYLDRILSGDDPRGSPDRRSPNPDDVFRLSRPQARGR